MDGLRWDLLNDGMGNPKRTRSLVNSYRIHPVMSMGVRESFDVAVLAGIKFILFAVFPDEDVEALKAYLRSVRTEPSPYLTADGQLSPAAQRGKKLFAGPARCAECHNGPLYTDLEAYDVGTLGELDQEGNVFYTTRLTEVYRTAPYLHDGRAVTMKEVLTTYNPQDKHGVTSNLTEQEIADLAEYVLSL
jgi:cytochrome c peroxidase